jgi:transposase-like protein
MRKKPRKKRRIFSAEFKAEAVNVVNDSGKSISAVARDLDLTESSLRNWVKQAEVDAGRGSADAMTTEEKEELRRLRRENKTLKMERDILKKATAFFAKEST